MVLGIQIVGVLFGIFLIYLTFIHQKRKEFNTGEFAVWVVVSIALIVLSLFPQILDPVTKRLNIARTMDLFIVLGFMFLIATNFYTHSIVSKTQSKLEELVRNIAYKEAEKEEKSERK